VTPGASTLEDVAVPPPRSAVPDVVAGAVAVASAVAVLGWDLLDPRAPSDGPTFAGMVLAFSAVYGATGALLAWHGAARVVRRVLLGVALAHAVGAWAAAVADRAADGGWLGETALWLSSWIWAPAYVAVPALLPLLLPDGRPVWRWAAWLSGAAVTWAGLSWALTPYELQDFPIEGHSNPVGVAAVASTWVDAVGTLLLVAAVVVALASLVVRYRRTTGLAREQLRWLLLGVLGTVVVGASAFVLPS
jgi:two-component system, NarL family, sensor kinase